VIKNRTPEGDAPISQTGVYRKMLIKKIPPV
jgi:hypothetical protein